VSESKDAYDNQGQACGRRRTALQGLRRFRGPVQVAKYRPMRQVQKGVQGKRAPAVVERSKKMNPFKQSTCNVFRAALRADILPQKPVNDDLFFTL